MHPENTPNMNNSELNPREVGAELASAQQQERPQSSPEEQLTNPGGEVDARQQEIMRLTESTERTKAKVNKIRKELGLPPTEEDPPSVFSETEKLKKLQTEQELLEKQREELVNQEERERLIREEKENILQERLDELFKEFESLNAIDFESIFANGKTREGRNVESVSQGELDPEVAKSLAKAFKEGIKLLPKILETLPELLKAFNEDLTKEATQRVEQKLAEEKQKTEKAEAKEKNPEVPDNEIPAGKIKREPTSIDPSSSEEKISAEAGLKQGEKRNDQTTKVGI
jgi:hypothetical protein